MNFSGRDINVIAESDILGIRVRLLLQKGDTEIYEWRFSTSETLSRKLCINLVNRAALTDGKPDYSNAKFYVRVLNPIDNAKFAEAKYFTN